jgi:hypothetical protein
MRLPDAGPVASWSASTLRGMITMIEKEIATIDDNIEKTNTDIEESKTRLLALERTLSEKPDKLNSTDPTVTPLAHINSRRAWLAGSPVQDLVRLQHTFSSRF